MQDVSGLLFASIALGVFAVPLIFRWVPPNPLYGFRTARTLASPSLWYRVNRFCGVAMLLASVVSVLLVLAIPPSPCAFLALLVPSGAALAASFVYLGSAR